MKAHFINLFNYDHYANQLIAELINNESQPEKPVQLMAHILAANKIWLNRCLGLPPADIQIWPALGATNVDFVQTINSNLDAWLSYLNGLEDLAFDEIFYYKNLKGDNWEDKLSDILTHLINHGTHHRAQIGQLIKSAGVENLPATDYIFYLRTKKAQ